MAGFETVAKTSELAPGRGRVVHVGGRAVALFNVAGQFHAIDNTCPHRAGPLGEGELEGRVVECPLHGWRFDVVTGRHAQNPAVAVARYEVRIEGDEVQVRVP